MKKEVTFVRVYTLEGHDHLNDIMNILHDEERVAGVTVIRGIAGYGASGKIHTSSLLSLSLELPLVVEFFDQPERAEKAIEKLRSRLNLQHIVSWPAGLHGAGQE